MVDAQTGLDWIRSREEMRAGGVVVFGQSLGGAVAVQLVARNKGRGDIRGLILENTFLSIRKMIPWLVISLFLKMAGWFGECVLMVK